MPRFPEILQFRAASGTSNSLDELARAEGKRVGDIVREAVETRLAAVKPPAAGDRKAV